MLTRRASLKLLYQKLDITNDIADDLEGFTYTDNASGSADSIGVTINNGNKKWLYSWAPNKGDTLQAFIKTINWRFKNDNQQLDCGIYTIDDINYSGRPSTVEIGAISVPTSLDFMNIKKNRTWYNATVQEIAESIASEHQISLFYDSSTNPVISFSEQDGTDSSFLYDLCVKSGLALKLFSNKMIIFSEHEYESKGAIHTFNESDLISWTAKNSWTDTGYYGCEVSYTEPSTGRTLKYTFYDKSIDHNKKILKVNETVDSLAEAELLAKSTLRSVNKNEYTISIEVTGNTKILASSCVNINDLGLFDGKYYIDKVVHSLGDKYTSSLEMHRVLEGY